MYTQIILLALVATSPLVTAHGKIPVVTGNLGGNGTALGIKGGVVPGPGPNYLTETDTTVFWSKSITTDDDIGYTESGNGNNKLTDLAASMALSGPTLPQVSAGGSVTGTYHIVTSDGAGPLQALIDETATAKWSKAKAASVTVQVPGTNGNVARELAGRVGLGGLVGRATNVNQDHPFAISIPAGTKCTGTINGHTGLCLVKVSNNNAAGPFGGVFVVQMPTSAKVKARRATQLVV